MNRFKLAGSSTGSTLTAIGSSALKNSGSAIQSTAVGYSAGLNAGGDANTIMGYAALGQNSSGSNNVAIGFAAGENSTGSNSIFLGYNAGLNASESNALYIDNSNTSSPLIYGNFADDSLVVNGELTATTSFSLTSDTKGVGIGREAPSGNTRLDIYRSTNNAEILLETGGDNDVIMNFKSQNENWYIGNTGTTKMFRIYDNGRSADRLVIDQSGNVGIGTTTPGDKIEAFSTGSVRMRTQTSSANFSGFVAENTNGEYFMGVQSTADGNSGEFHIYQNAGSGNVGQRLVIDHEGNVGMNESDPSSKLDVGGDIEIDAGTVGDDAFYFGDPDTDGSWRIKRDGNDLSFERRESGVWVFKVKMNP